MVVTIFTSLREFLTFFPDEIKIVLLNFLRHFLHMAAEAGQDPHYPQVHVLSNLNMSFFFFFFFSSFDILTFQVPTVLNLIWEWEQRNTCILRIKIVQMLAMYLKCFNWSHNIFIALEKVVFFSAEKYWFFPISPWKHILWLLIRCASMRHF